MVALPGRSSLHISEIVWSASKGGLSKSSWGSPCSNIVTTTLLAIQQPSLESRRQYQAALLGFQLAHETAPKHLLNTSFLKTSTPRTLRQRTPLQLPVPNTSLFQWSPLYFASHTFNNLPPHIRSINTLPEFKRKAQQHILSYSCPCSRHLN